ncbi:MAG: ComF family protein [Lentisphaerae bacterium]|nr:ComF family protein [Lentisphaerota bacterium]
MFSLSSVISEILPCPGCGGNSGQRGNTLCDDCLRELEIIPEDAECCPGCGGIMTGALACCTQCLAEPERPWSRAFTVMHYRGMAGTLIRRFKFYNTPELARALGYLLAGKIRQNKISADMIVPVPLHFTRLFNRGYNQSLLLAQIAGKECGIPVRAVLKRKHLRSHQAGRSRTDRHKELAGSMILKDEFDISGKNILLLDDVFTTGATLHAATLALKKGDPASVKVITLARTPGHSGF